MNLKVRTMTSTQALDAGTTLDDMVNEFIKDIEHLASIDYKVDQGEVYVFLVWEEEQSQSDIEKLDLTDLSIPQPEN